MDRGQADTGHHRLTALMTGVVLAALPATARAEQVCNPSETNTEGVVSLIVENDSLSSGKDRNYTSGVELGYVSPENCRIPRMLSDAAKPITHAISNADPAFWGIALGQSIFTPQDTQADPAPPDQHPYAGWLYLQIAVAAEVKPSDAHPTGYLDTYDLQFGMVGPSALGRQAQNGIHSVLGAPEARGWDSQLHDEFTFGLSLDRRWDWKEQPLPIAPNLSYDFTPTAGATIGTLRDEVRVGLIARIGDHLNGDYGPPRVRPSLASVEQFYNRDLSWNLFAGVEGRAVAHDIFLDGNTFRDSAHVKRVPFVADFQAGLSISSGEWRMTYTYVWRTNEFTTQDGHQDFGSLSLSRRF